jgi:hypothetical protein
MGWRDPRSQLNERRWGGYGGSLVRDGLRSLGVMGEKIVGVIGWGEVILFH